MRPIRHRRDPRHAREAAGSPVRAALLASLATALLLAALPADATAQDDAMAKIRSAVSAAPASITDGATIMDWDQTVLREGSNDWTCFPDVPDNGGNDPMCVDGPWLAWAHAWMNREDFSIDRIGFGYMLQGGAPNSNLDPFAEGPTEDNEWLDEDLPHVMMIVPDPAMLDGLPDHPDESSGGPWVMWKGTPYVHVMIPTPRKPGG